MNAQRDPQRTHVRWLRLRSWAPRLLAAGRSPAAAAPHERAIFPAAELPGRPLRRRRLGLLRWLHRLPAVDQHARRRRERRQADLVGVRDRVRGRARRRMLRAPEEGAQRRARPPPPTRCASASPTRRSIAQTADKIPLITINHGRTDSTDGSVFPYVFPLQLNPYSEIAAIITWIGAEGGRRRQAEGQEDRHALSRLALRQGDDPDPRSLREEVRLRDHPHRGPAPRQRAAVAVAEHPPHQARLGDPARLGRHEPGGDQDRRQDRLPGRPHHRQHLEQRRGGRESRRRGRQGLHRDHHRPVGHQLPGAARHRQARGQGRARATSRTRSASAPSTTTWASRTGSSTSRRFAPRRPSSASARSPARRSAGASRTCDIDEQRLKELGALGLLQPIKLSCSDHEGGGAVRFQQWDGQKWVTISDWVHPDRAVLRPDHRELGGEVRQGEGDQAARLRARSARVALSASGAERNSR